MDAYKYYKDLPTWAKGVVVIGVLGAVGYIGYTTVKRLRDDAKKREALKTLDTTRQELEEQINSGVLPSYEKSVYDGIALSLKDQFSGCDCCWSPGFNVTDYGDLSGSGKALYDKLSTFNSDRDFLELVDSFGIQTYDDCGWGTGNVENVNLYQAVANELASGELPFINLQLRNRGITYQF
jgi:hypothetical protein